MNTKQQIWFLHLGFAPIPKSWYENRNPGKIDGRCNKQMPYDYLKGMKKLRRGICAILKSGNIPTKTEAYETLSERNFIPAVKEGKLMSETRFYHYWYETIKQKGITRTRKSKAQYIADNYKTKSIDEIAKHIGSSKHYVKEVILECKRGIR